MNDNERHIQDLKQRLCDLLGKEMTKDGPIKIDWERLGKKTKGKQFLGRCCADSRGKNHEK